MSGAAYESMSLQRRIMRQALPNLCRTFAAPNSAVLNWFIRRSSAVPNSSIKFGTWEVTPSETGLRPLEMSRLKDLKRQHLIQNVMSLYYLGRNLTTVVLSTHNVSYLSSCAVHCFNTSTACIGFKYRSSINPQPNCELFKAMRICNSKPKNTTHGGTWQFYEAVRDKPVRWIHTVYLIIDLNGVNVYRKRCALRW
jgi:hypothetical protein